MQKTQLVLLSLFTWLFTFQFSTAQTYSDDFESYEVGDLIAQVNNTWTTWSNSPGSAEDAPVTDEQASSGTKSLVFEGTQGPIDLVLPFGDKYETGLFTFSTMLYIEANKGAYWNFQAEETIGQVWALEFYFTGTGDYRLASEGTNHIVGTYPQGEWFEVQMVINLNENNWTLSFDGQEQGSFNNPINAVASLDIFPFETTSGAKFYMDDISFEHEEIQLLPNDISLVSLSIPQITLSGTEVPLSFEVKNAGENPIESFDFAWTDGGMTLQESFTGLNIASLESQTFTLGSNVTIGDGDQSLNGLITNVNGGNDDNESNNEAASNVYGVVPTGKKVLVEEFTGTWCPWCPRGAVYMEYMINTYPDYFVGIAVHGGSISSDPMTVEGYPSALSSLIGGAAYPEVVINRNSGQVLNPSGMETPVLLDLESPHVANFDISGTYSGVDYSIEMETEILQTLDGDYNVSMVIFENGVTGTGSGYNQANAYAGGGNGPMGGYEFLSNPVPASQMVYNEVARALLGGLNGNPGIIDTNPASGTTYSATYSYEASEEFNAEELYAVCILIDNSTNQVVAVDKFRLLDKLSFTNTIEAKNSEISLNLAPNPATDRSFVSLTVDQSQDAELKIIAADGRIIEQRGVAVGPGINSIELNTSAFSAGVYFVQIYMNNTVYGEKLHIVK